MNHLVESDENCDWVYPKVVKFFGGPLDGGEKYIHLDTMKNWFDLVEWYPGPDGEVYMTTYRPRFRMEIKDGRRVCTLGYIWKGLKIP